MLPAGPSALRDDYADDSGVP